MHEWIRATTTATSCICLLRFTLHVLCCIHTSVSEDEDKEGLGKRLLEAAEKCCVHTDDLAGKGAQYAAEIWCWDVSTLYEAAVLAVRVVIHRSLLVFMGLYWGCSKHMLQREAGDTNWSNDAFHCHVRNAISLPSRAQVAAFFWSNIPVQNNHVVP